MKSSSIIYFYGPWLPVRASTPGLGWQRSHSSAVVRSWEGQPLRGGGQTASRTQSFSKMGAREIFQEQTRDPFYIILPYFTSGFYHSPVDITRGEVVAARCGSERHEWSRLTPHLGRPVCGRRRLAKRWAPFRMWLCPSHFTRFHAYIYIVI